MAKHTIREELYGVFAFVGLIWCVFFVEQVAPFELESYGIKPRTLDGLVGIPAAPFLHANLEHLISNTIPLTVLLLLLAGSQARTWVVVTSIVFLSGALLWMFGRSANHIGASGLIYGLITYLIISGVRERRVIPIITSLVVGFLYGGALLSGVVPSSTPHISWEGHLFGAIAGGVVAVWLTRNRNGAETPVIAG
jgi:membrane associated rhomboid family serine protease